MKMRQKLAAATLPLWLMGAPTAAIAQEAAEPEAQAVPAAAAPAAQAPTAPGAGLGEGGKFNIDQSIDVPPEKMVSEANKSLEEMRAALSRAMDVLAKARESKDVIRLNCVNEKLTPMKGILKIAEDALIGLQENIATGNVEAASYEYSKIRISHEKVSTLMVQAVNCIGAEATYTGDTEVDLDVNPDVTGADDPYYGDPQILVDPAYNVVDPDPDNPNTIIPNPIIEIIASPYN